jgi:hypothetical protein
MPENLSGWQEWKNNLGETRPWDILNPSTEYSDQETAENRFSICKSCPELIGLTKQCKKCGCFMELKTKLHKAACPLGKW